MATTEILLPFVRNVEFSRPDSRGRIERERILDLLPVTVEVAPPCPKAVKSLDPDGFTRQSYFVHAGRPLMARHGSWMGEQIDDAVRLMTSELQASGNLLPASFPEGKHVRSDGKADQEEARRRLEAKVVVMDGALYARSPVPTWGVRVDWYGRAEYGSMDSMGGGVPAWMSFPLTRRADARGMAEAVAEGLADAVPGRDWRRSHHQGVARNLFDNWTVENRDAFAGLDFAEGGEPSASEAERAFAIELVGLLTPHIGHFGDDTILAFLALRRSATDGAELRDELDELVSELRSTALPEALQQRDRDDLSEAAFCLDLRLRKFDPRPVPDAETAQGPRP